MVSFDSFLWKGKENTLQTKAVRPTILKVNSSSFGSHICQSFYWESGGTSTGRLQFYTNINQMGRQAMISNFSKQQIMPVSGQNSNWSYSGLWCTRAPLSTRCSFVWTEMFTGNDGTSSTSVHGEQECGCSLREQLWMPDYCSRWNLGTATQWRKKSIRWTNAAFWKDRPNRHLSELWQK